jgi:hypothetical protein
MYLPVREPSWWRTNATSFLAIPILTGSLWNQLKFHIGTEPQTHSPLPVPSDLLTLTSFFFPYSADKQSRSQGGLSPGQHQLPASSIPCGAVHHHWNWHLRGRGRRPHRLPLQEQPPMSFLQAGMEGKDLGQVCGHQVGRAGQG